MKMRRLDSGARGCSTPAEIAKIVGALYADVHGLVKYKQIYRPYICPFHALIDFVPIGATVLDVGCGAGLWISVLASLGRIQTAVGFDADTGAINVARGIAAKLPRAAGISFEKRNANEPWPEGRFDVVSLIDVVHHVRPESQPKLIAAAAAHVAVGGILLYKDMASRPLWRAWANRLHDLLSAGEWISHAKLDDVIGWAQAAGLRSELKGSMNMLWYRHEWCVFRRA
jgi:2-polyprenyl-3-methyl-5-hydroxy-6-metoxy-1,4-benzoquinol methylase